MKEKSKNFASKIVIAVLIWAAVLFVLILYVISCLRKFDGRLSQHNQLRAIRIGLEFFSNVNNHYPPSGGLDPTGQPYCGAMKLSEALIGKDLLGFHPDSEFRADGLDTTGRQLYDPNTLRDRKELFLAYDNANAYRLFDIYGSGKTGPFNENNLVLCDVYKRKMGTGNRTGMPILYYKENTSNTEHDANNPDNPKNIYNYKDNHALLSLGVPWKPKKQHPLFLNPKIFYVMTRDWRDNTVSRPHQSDSFILISAGFDGLYGTADDICNFEWKYRE